MVFYPFRFGSCILPSFRGYIQSFSDNILHNHSGANLCILVRSAAVHTAVDALQNLLLFGCIHTNALQCFSRSAVGADKGFIVPPRECRRCGVGFSAKWAYSDFCNCFILHFHSSCSSDKRSSEFCCQSRNRRTPQGRCGGSKRMAFRSVCPHA